jgi:hypothetical protein
MLGPYVIHLCLPRIGVFFFLQLGGGATHMRSVRFQVSTAVTMKNAIFWDVLPYDSCKNRLSEERIAAIIRIGRISELGTTLAVISNSVARY